MENQLGDCSIINIYDNTVKKSVSIRTYHYIIIILYHKFDIINLARISHGIDTLGDNVMEQVLVPVLRKRIKRKKKDF